MMRSSLIIRSVLVFIMTMAMGSCSLISDDLQPCPEGIDVRFLYDYNVERADMFNDHVGSVTLFVYDLSGNLVREQTESNSATSQPLSSPSYTMHVEGLPSGRYRLKGIANQRESSILRGLPGIRYQWTDLQKDDRWDGFSVTLTTDSRDAGDYQPVTDSSQQLDTLWMGHGVDLGGFEAEYVEGMITQASVSLIRDTKRLHLSLRQLDHPDHCDISDYEITLIDRNTVLRYDNSVDDEASGIVVYRPFDEWNTYYQAAEGAIVEETAHADIDFNRLMLRPATESPATLIIRHRSDDRVVAQVNLPELLSQGRGAFERDNYSPQEFLDRCYDYHLDFILLDGEWRYITLRIHTLPWVKRFQRTIIG